MKIRNTSAAIFFCLIMTGFSALAQENAMTDPILKFKNGYEIGLSANGTRVNTNYTHFETTHGLYDFKKNHYLPGMDATFNYSWLFKSKDESDIWIIKSGVNLVNRSADVTNALGATQRLSTGYLQIPIIFGFRSPLQYNTIKNNLFRAFEIHAGFYAATPIMQKLDDPNNIDAAAQSLNANYLKFGFMGDITFTALDSKGHGHKFGIRVSNDFNSIVKFKDTPNQLYPYYYSLGMFYNITNRYR
jgi:hypothetical protein